MKSALTTLVLMALSAPVAMSQETTALSDQASNLPSSTETPTPTPPSTATNFEPRYITGKWSYPNTDNEVAYYPPKALEQNKAGLATVDCELDHEGFVVACRIVSEDPKGYDFGYMTASMFINFAHVDPASVEGGLKDGDRRKFTYKWSLNAPW